MNGPILISHHTGLLASGLGLLLLLFVVVRFVTFARVELPLLVCASFVVDIHHVMCATIMRQPQQPPFPSTVHS